MATSRDRLLARIRQLFKRLRDTTGEEFEITPKEAPVTAMLLDATVCIDPGHGLYQTSQGIYSFQRTEENGILEDLLTVRVAMLLAEELRTRVRRVIMTRPENNFEGSDRGRSGQPRWQECALYYLEGAAPEVVELVREKYPKTSDRGKDLYVRAEYANAEEADVFISMHSNASGHGAARGFEVWSPAGRTRHHTTSRALAERIDEAVADGFKSRGTKGFGATPGSWEYDWSRKLVVLAKTKMPAVVVECFFYDNPHDAKLLQNDRRLRALASKMADGIVAYLEA